MLYFQGLSLERREKSCTAALGSVTRRQPNLGRLCPHHRLVRQIGVDTISFLHFHSSIHTPDYLGISWGKTPVPCYSIKNLLVKTTSDSGREVPSQLLPAVKKAEDVFRSKTSWEPYRYLSTTH